MFNKLFAAAATVAALSLPMAAQAVTVTTNSNGATPPTDGGAPVSISIGDIFTMELDGNAADVGGSASFGFTATEALLSIESNSLNTITGFADAVVSWFDNAAGAGMALASISGSALTNGDSLDFVFGSGDTYYLVASWSDVTADLSNFDLNVSATAVPLPAGALLMGTALAGFGIARRRKKA